MKVTFAILLASLVCMCPGQTFRQSIGLSAVGEPTKPTAQKPQPPEGVKAEDFRMVNGQLYNIKKSAKWEAIAYLKESGGYVSAELVVEKIAGNDSVQCQQYIYTHDARGNRHTRETHLILLKNYPRPYVNEEIKECIAFRLPANVGDEMAVYDFGTANTNRPAKKLGTNAPARLVKPTKTTETNAPVKAAN